MTREQLVYAVMSCTEDCKTCIENQLIAYEAQIKTKAIDEFVAFANTMPTIEEEDGKIRPMWLEEMAQKLKEQK